MCACRYVEETTHGRNGVEILHCRVLPFHSINNICSSWAFSFLQILPFFIEAFRISPLLIGFIIYCKTNEDIYLDVGVFVFFLFLLVLTSLALVPTGSENPSRLEKIARYVSVYGTRKLLIGLLWWELAASGPSGAHGIQ